ncbi:MAG: hypothetical protein ACE5K9_10405 [Candidatus Methylomirabilales bacterium]
MNRADSKRLIGALIALSISVVSYACAKPPTKTTQVPSARSPFPSREELSQLGQSPLRRDLFDVPMRDVDSWQLKGDFPKLIQLAPHQPSSPWEELLAEQARRIGGTLYPSAAMHCVAREYARFYSVQGVRPTERLVQYMAGACGAIAQDITPMVLHARVPEAVSDDDLLRHWKEALTRFSASIQGELRIAGLAFVREKERAVVAVVHGERRVEVNPLVPVPDAHGHVLVEGRLLVPAERIHAMINRGRYGFAACAVHPGIPLPRFAILCEMAKSDELSWIEISFLPPGRILFGSALQVLARVPGTSVDRYRRPVYAKSSEAATPEQFTAKLTKALNEVRERAKLPPLALATRQSEVAAALAPRFFAAGLGKADPLDADRIALGMTAGWDVQGVIREGAFFSTLIGETRDVSRWLSTALEFPGGRQVLLSPDATKLAVGPLLVDQNELLGAIVSSYSFFDENHAADAAKIFNLIARRRIDLRLSAPKRLEALDSHMVAAGRIVRSRSASPRDALNDLLQVSVRVLQRSVNGFVLEASRLEVFQLPEEFLRRRSLELAIGVTHYRPGWEPWARYVILVVVAEPLPSV